MFIDHNQATSPDAKYFPLESNATDITAFVWPFSSATCCIELTSHTLTVQSSEPAKKRGGDGQQLQNINRNTVIMKFCDNFAAKHFTSSRNPSCNRHHIFTIMSSISRATQSYEYSNAEHMQTYFQLSIQQKKTGLFNKTFWKKIASQLQTSEAATKRLKFSSLQWIVSFRQSNNLFKMNKAAKKEPEYSPITKPHRH